MAQAPTKRLVSVVVVIVVGHVCGGVGGEGWGEDGGVGELIAYELLPSR